MFDFLKKKHKNYDGPRFFVLPPTGMPGSGHFCWWTVKDHEVDLTKYGNNITDYVYAGLPDAEQVALGLAERYNRGAEKPLHINGAFPRSWGGPEFKRA